MPEDTTSVRSSFTRRRWLCRKAKLGPDHPDTLTSMNNLANSYADAGQHDGALKLREETLALRKAKLGPDHPDTLRHAQPRQQLRRRRTDTSVRSSSGRRRWLCERRSSASTTLTRWPACTTSPTATPPPDRTIARSSFVKRRWLCERRCSDRHHPDTLNSMYNLAVLLCRSWTARPCAPISARRCLR